MITQRGIRLHSTIKIINYKLLGTIYLIFSHKCGILFDLKNDDTLSFNEIMCFSTEGSAMLCVLRYV